MSNGAVSRISRQPVRGQDIIKPCLLIYIFISPSELDRGGIAEPEGVREAVAFFAVNPFANDLSGCPVPVSVIALSIEDFVEGCIQITTNYLEPNIFLTNKLNFPWMVSETF